MRIYYSFRVTTMEVHNLHVTLHILAEERDKPPLASLAPTAPRWWSGGDIASCSPILWTLPYDGGFRETLPKASVVRKACRGDTDKSLRAVMSQSLGWFWIFPTATSIFRITALGLLALNPRPPSVSQWLTLYSPRANGFIPGEAI